MKNIVTQNAINNSEPILPTKILTSPAAKEIRWEDPVCVWELEKKGHVVFNIPRVLSCLFSVLTRREER